MPANSPPETVKTELDKDVSDILLDNEHYLINDEVTDIDLITAPQSGVNVEGVALQSDSFVDDQHSDRETVPPVSETYSTEHPSSSSIPGSSDSYSDSYSESNIDSTNPPLDEVKKVSDEKRNIKGEVSLAMQVNAIFGCILPRENTRIVGVNKNCAV